MGPENNDHYLINRAADSRKPAPIEQLVPEQYLLLSKIAEGGMGSIYAVQNRYTGARFAIKVLLPEFAHDKEFGQRFKVEATAAMSLKHANICQVHDCGVTAGQSLYLVMDWIDGISLQEKVQRDGPLDRDTVVLVYQQIAMAMAHAHQHHIVHRDLKPDNIMLSNNALPAGTHAYLVDFGVAKMLKPGIDSQGLTTVGMVVGTPMFMSPEQARAIEVDGRSDIYSLGCVIYFALTGQNPFLGDTVMDTMYKHVHETPPEFDPKLKVSADLRSIVFKSMEKAPENRYQSAEQLLDDITKLTRGISLGKVSLTSEQEKRSQKIMTMVLFIVGFVVMYFASTLIQVILDKALPDKENRAHTSGAK